MFRKQTPAKTNLNVSNSYIGERIEEKIKRILNNKEPITDGAPLIYTERKDGVMGDYNIREDKWEHAIDATDKMTKSRIAKREKGIADREAQAEGYKDAVAKKTALDQAAKDAKNGNNQ